MYRLVEDHKKAKEIGSLFTKNKNYVNEVLNVYTNIVIFKLNPNIITGEMFEQKLAKQNIKIAAFGKNTIRMVTHLDYTNQMHDKVLTILNSIYKIY
ncbi:MAG: hypothetical protein U0V03_04345 [Bacteroidia bacterium]